jgi:NAD(P)-dependent dehydrogenase (short-subunit alcohol dehydrogenase family)
LRESFASVVYTASKPELTSDPSSRVNSKAAFLILQESAKNVQDGGKIITIVTSLLAAFTGMYTAYAGSKAPVEHFTRGAAKELSSRRISVNAIAPGPMNTRKWTLLVLRTSDLIVLTCHAQPSSTRKSPTTPLHSTKAWPWKVV